jgi:hypothetical protein
MNAMKQKLRQIIGDQLKTVGMTQQLITFINPLKIGIPYKIR